MRSFTDIHAVNIHAVNIAHNTVFIVFFLSLITVRVPRLIVAGTLADEKDY